MADVDAKRIYEEIKALREDIDYIKKNMVDADMIMTAEEAKRFDASMQELKVGKATSLANAKKQLGL